ncbi:MAG: MFS transporter [Oscillospiraceae bacterium]
MRNKLTRSEKDWILYDVGNSAFILLVSTIFPIYFNALAADEGLSSADYLAYWGYAASIATLIVAVLGPVLGKASDRKKRRKPLFLISIIIGAAGCALLGFTSHWLVFLIIFVIAKSGHSMSLIFYDSMLSDITSEERMDNVSAQGYAWGYIGSCIPFVISLAVILGADYIGISMTAAMTISFIISALWWLLVSMPLIKSYRQPYEDTSSKGNVLAELKATMHDIVSNKKILLFLAAYFFYIDGVYTIIEMATAYGSALGLDSTGLLLALLATQIIAFPSSVIIGRLSEKYPVKNLIMICIGAYFVIAVFAVFMSSQLHFWILAAAVGMFQGGIQALSRSYYAKIIPPEKSGGYFGILDICGKGASFMGTLVISAVSQLTGNVNAGVGAISIFFIIGLILFMLQIRAEQQVERSHQIENCYSSDK